MPTENKICKVINTGESATTHKRFFEIECGDTVFIDGIPLIVTVEAHLSGDFSYDGYILYTGNDGWFPEDLD